jgi:hypothetical protein
MEVSEEESVRCIDELAQGLPFKFVDKVCFLNESCVVTELHGRGMPYRFADTAQADTYAILEFAAQSSGLVLRNRKLSGRRGVISSFQDVQRKKSGVLYFPLRLESTLVDQRWSFFEFHFKVYSDSDIAVVGGISIFIGS